ncbi:hypothetical protein SUNI508_09236 [Seiridium unicorne]|uniref:Uncharacterized protein n=1 Tax=Seiridium unicorne TaxID=138068 RepID=A0ABR2UR36_9PEZI
MAIKYKYKDFVSF